MQFLEQESFDAAKELLVMYYFQRGRYVEGVRLNEELKQYTVVRIDTSLKFISLNLIVKLCSSPVQ